MLYGFMGAISIFIAGIYRYQKFNDQFETSRGANATQITVNNVNDMIEKNLNHNEVGKDSNRGMEVGDVYIILIKEFFRCTKQ